MKIISFLVLFFSFIFLGKCVKIVILGKIGEKYGLKTARRTLAYAKSAVFALVVIDDREIVFNRDRAMRTGLFALLTSYTSIFTSLTGIGALLLV